MENVFYFRQLNTIGGVESFFYYLSQLYKNMVVYYDEADPEQVKRLAKNIEVHKHNGEKIKCKRLFGNYGLDTFLPYVEAEEKYFVIHCDYKKNKVCKPLLYPGFKYIAVSKIAGESFKDMTGIDYELIYNPVVVNKPKVEKSSKLKLISATRLSGEKGGWRILKLAEMLDKKGIEYEWDVYSNKTEKINRQHISPNIHLKQPKLDLSKEIAESSYLVQLSDHEAFGLSVAESLMLGTPVIVTDIPAFHEIGCNENNSIIVDLNMLNVDIDKIVNSKFEFKYKPPKSNWGKYLDNETTYNPKEIVEVQVIKRKLTLIEEKKVCVKGDITKVTKERAAYLEALGYVKW